MALKHAEAVGVVFEDPQVSEWWNKLVEWLDKYGVYWREEVLGLITHVELLVSAVLRAAESRGLDKGKLAREVCERVRALLASHDIEPENVEGYELKGVRKEVAEIVAVIFPKLQSPSVDSRKMVSAATTAIAVEQALGDVCPECGSRLVFLKTLRRYYCFTCKKYR